MMIKDVVGVVDRCTCPISKRIPKKAVILKRTAAHSPLLDDIPEVQIFEKIVIDRLFSAQAEASAKHLSSNKGSASSSSREATSSPVQLETFAAQRLVTMLMLAACQAVNQNAANAQEGREALWDFTPPKPPILNAEGLNYQPERIYTYLNGCSQETLNIGVSDLNAYMDVLLGVPGTMSNSTPNSIEASFLTGIGIETITRPKEAHFIQGKIFVASAKNAPGRTNPLNVTPVPSVVAVSITATPATSSTSTTTSTSSQVVSSSPSAITPVVTSPSPTTQPLPMASANQSFPIPTIQDNPVTAATLSASTTPTTPVVATASSLPPQQRPASSAENKTQTEITTLENILPPNISANARAPLVTSWNTQERLVGTLTKLNNTERKLATSEQKTAALLAYKSGREAADAQQRAAALAAAMPKPKTAVQKASELRRTVTGTHR